MSTQQLTAGISISIANDGMLNDSQLDDYISKMDRLAAKVGAERMKTIDMLINTLTWAERAYNAISNPHKTDIEKIIESGTWAFQFKNCVRNFRDMVFPREALDAVYDKADEICEWIAKNYGLKIAPEIFRDNGKSEVKKIPDVAADMDRYVKILSEYRSKLQKGNSK